MANPKEKTPMCLVNELARFNKIQPEYKLLCEQGPAHSKVPTGSTQSFKVTYASGILNPPPPLLLFPLPAHACQIFSVRLTLGDQYWEAEGPSIKKAQHSAAASALVETTLPKPTLRTPRNTNRIPGGFPTGSCQLVLCCGCFAEALPPSFLYLSSTVDGITHTMELNALCMKLGKKPIYKPIDPYPGMRPPNFHYNIRPPGPYQRSMQQ